MVTEVYFAVAEDDRLRENDQVYKSRGPRGRELIMPLEDPAAHKEITSPEPGSVCCRFDVVYRAASPARAFPLLFVRPDAYRSNMTSDAGSTRRSHRTPVIIVRPVKSEK